MVLVDKLIVCFDVYHTILQIFFAGDNINNKEYVGVGVGGYTCSMKLQDFMHQNVHVQVYVHVQCTMIFL